MKSVIVCLLFAAVCFAQSGLPSLSDKDIPGLAVARDEIYDGEGLWGYIDGGADIYLEYGFDKMRVLECTLDGIRIKADIYQMKTPEAAAGILSVSRFQCGYGDSLPLFHCVTPFQVQAARGALYLSVTNEKGTDIEKSAAVRLARALLAKAGGTDIALPVAFADIPPGMAASAMKYMRGPLGLDNGAPELAPLLNGIRAYEIFLLPFADRDSAGTRAHFQFADESSLERFFMNAGFNAAQDVTQRTEGKTVTRLRRLSSVSAELRIINKE